MTRGCHDGYLEQMAEMGFLCSIDRFSYTVGEDFDPPTGQRRCFVEHADPRILADPDLLHRLRQRLLAQFPDVDVLVIRVVGEELLPTPWYPALTYVRRDGLGDGATPNEHGVSVRRATPVDEEKVRGWLVEAAMRGQEEEGRAPVVTVAESFADRVLARTDRLSLVATRNEVATGHATLLFDFHDHVSDTDFVQLVDTLVEPGDHLRSTTNALVDAALAEAASVGRPLLGDVVHPVPTRDPDGGGRIVRSLVASGWTVDHAFWHSGTTP